MPTRVGPLTRLFDELLWSLRRNGFAVATSQALDVARALRAVGLDEPFRVREAVAAVVVQRASDRARFDRVFDDFFAARRAPGALWDRLLAAGFAIDEIEAAKELLTSVARAHAQEAEILGTLLERGADLDRLLHRSGLGQRIEAHSRLQLGFYTHRVLQHVGAPRAYRALALLRSQLVDALGPDRGGALADALKRELDATADEVRDAVRIAFDERERERGSPPRSLEQTPFTALKESEIDEVRRAIRSFAVRLRGGLRVRLRRATRGRIDPHRTLRRALATGGVPFAPIRKRRRRDRPRLVLLCDVSDSVRQAACFMLELVYAAHELFGRTRSFVFVSDLAESTELFERESPTVALGRAYGGGVVSVADNSSYGRALRTFERRHLDSLDRRTTVVILGDGRTNYRDDGVDVLDRIRARARALIWLCPEPRSQWSLGDSAMNRYAPKCTAVYEVQSARDLEDAARRLVTHR